MGDVGHPGDGDVAQVDGDGVVGGEFPLAGEAAAGGTGHGGPSARQGVDGQVTEQVVADAALHHAGEPESLVPREAGEVAVSVAVGVGGEVALQGGPHGHAGFQSQSPPGVDLGVGPWHHDVPAYGTGQPGHPDAGAVADGGKRVQRRDAVEPVGSSKHDGIRRKEVVGEAVPELRRHAPQESAFAVGKRHVCADLSGKQRCLPRKSGRPESGNEAAPVLPDDILPGRLVTEIDRGFDDRIEPGVGHLQVQGIAPVPFFVRVRVQAVTHHAGQGAQVVLEESCQADRSRLVGKVHGPFLHGVVVHVQRQPGMQPQRIRQLVVAFGGRHGHRFLQVHRLSQRPLLGGERIFDGVAMQISIRYFLRRKFAHGRAEKLHAFKGLCGVPELVFDFAEIRGAVAR